MPIVIGFIGLAALIALGHLWRELKLWKDEEQIRTAVMAVVLMLSIAAAVFLY